MELTGKIIAQLPLESGTTKAGNAWQKKTFVIETEGQYPKKVAFTLFGEKVNQHATPVGDTVTVHFDLASREYNGRWYTEASCWNVSYPQGAAPQVAPAQPAPAPQPQQTADSLPF